MSSHWIRHPKGFLYVPVILGLAFIISCGGAAPPEPVIVEKEVIKEVPVEVVVEKEVVREVVREVVVVATPVAQAKPERVVPAAGTITAAVLQTRAGSCSWYQEGTLSAMKVNNKQPGGRLPTE